MKNNRPWYRIAAQADGQEEADIFIYDIIGGSFWEPEAVSAKQLIKEINALPDSVKTIHVHVNSPGGNVFDAVAIANFLKDHKATIDVIVEALAASAASIVVMAGDAIRIADNALMMIHDPSGLVWGTAKDMREMAGALDKIRDAIVATYRWHVPLEVEEIRSLMEKTTWMSAEEAVEMGFATEVLDRSVASEPVDFDPDAVRILASVPERYHSMVYNLIHPEKPIAPSSSAEAVRAAVPSDSELIRAQAIEEARHQAREIYDLCAKAGVSQAASDYLNRGMTIDEVKERLADADQIRSICVAAGLPGRADGYIMAGLKVDEVRTKLLDARKALENDEIDNKHIALQQHPTAQKPPFDPHYIYSSRRVKQSQTRR